MTRQIAPVALSLLISAFGSSAVGQDHPPAGARSDAIDAFVAEELERQQVPGVAVGIFADDGPSRLTGYGLANVEHDVPVRLGTLFQSGSIGKQFTAVATMLMVEDGRLELDASVRDYLPDAPPSWQAITVRHLLNHTGGLGDTDLDYRADYGDDELLRAFYATPPEFPAGGRWSYSNPGYVTLGILVGKVGGKPYGEVLRDRVFGPLGMRTARVISDRDIVPNRAAGYDLTEDGLKNHEWVSAALNATADGSLYLSLRDYERWLEAVAARGVLKPESWDEVLRPAPLADGGSYPYGFGWDLGRGPDGQAVIGHGGAWQGFTSDLRRYEGDGVSFVVLANGSHADAGGILQGVAERYDPRYVEPEPEPVADGRPGMTEALLAALDGLRAGTLQAEDVPGIPAARFGRWREWQQEALGQATGCRPPELLAEQPNGDRPERDYRMACDGVGLRIGAVFSADERPVAFWLDVEE